MKPPRRIKPLPIYVRPLSGGADDLQAAAQMAQEWGEKPFDESQALANLAPRDRSHIALLAFRNGEAVGLLRGEAVRLWSEPRPCAFAPLVWTRGVCETGGQVPPPQREAAALALARGFLRWARENDFARARVVFRAGMIPDSRKLAAAGLRREFWIFLRRAALPGDMAGGRVRWFSTETREAKAHEMELPAAKMFPELFLDERDLPPVVRRLETADEAAALATVRASRRARQLPFSETHFRDLFRQAVLRPDCCALATTSETKNENLSGVVIGRAAAHPLAAGCFSRIELLEWRADGAKSARRTAWGLWRGFAFWSARRWCRALLMIPPEGKFGEELARKCRLTPFGVCWSAEREAQSERDEDSRDG